MASRCLRCCASALSPLRHRPAIRPLGRRAIAPAGQLVRLYARAAAPGMPPTPSRPRKPKVGMQQATLEPSPIFAAYNLPKFDPNKRAAAKSTQKKKVRQQTDQALERKRQRREAREAARKRPREDDDKSYAYKSLFLKTSVKKLGNLARQIAHKDIDHAITQMRFSSKRVAQSILHNLEHAKEEAIRLHDMQDGKIVVDQAWVGRGPFIKQFWPRARGRMNIRMRPRTSFSVLLRSADKVAEERERVKVRKMWRQVRPLNERKPIYNPRPYYTW